MQKKSVILYISILLIIFSLMNTKAAVLQNPNKIQPDQVNNGGNSATIGTDLVGTATQQMEASSAPTVTANDSIANMGNPIYITSQSSFTTNGTTPALNTTSLPQTFEEWRNFLLAWYNMTPQDLQNASPIAVNSLNQEAQIYEGWVNGTYTDQQKSQLLAEIHDTPTVSTLVYISTLDNNFGYSFSLSDYNLGEWISKLDIYITNSAGSCDTTGGNQFSDGSSEKVYGPYLPTDPYPYFTLPHDSALDPAESFMGPHILIWQLYDIGLGGGPGTMGIDFLWQTGISGIRPGDHYLVFQVLWSYDELLVWPPLTYKRHFFWLTEFYLVTISDDDTTGPTIPYYNALYLGGGWSPITFDGQGASGGNIPVVPDNMEYIPLNVCMYEEQRGIAPFITFNGIDYPSTCLGKQTIVDSSGNTIDSYWYSILVPNPVTAGDHTANVTVWNNDNDWPGDRDPTTFSFVFDVIDVTPPVTTISLSGTLGLNGWYTSDVTVSLTSLDFSSGVAGTMYSFDGTNWFSYVGPFTVSAEGATTVYYYSTDNAGNVEAVKTATIMIDTTPPATSISLSGTQGLMGWYTSDVTVTLSATDATSGVANTMYSFDGTNWFSYVGPFTVSAEGATTVYYYSTDNAGNMETVKTATIMIDETPPTTTISLSGTLGLNGWYVSPVTVALTATDDFSGVSATQYSFNGVDWNTYSVPFNVTSEGVSTVYYRSIDNAGNVEDTKSVTVAIDTLPPTTTANLVGSKGLGIWYVSDVTVSLTAVDATSGVAATAYRINGGAWTTYTGSFVLTAEGIYKIEYNSTDNAGNVGQTNSVTIGIDKTPPTSGASLSGTLGLNGWYVSGVTVTLSAIDNCSGVSSTQYSFDGVNWNTYSAPFTISTEGVSNLYFRSIDNAGNLEQTKSVEIKIDTKPPTTQLLFSPEYTNITGSIFVTSGTEFTLTATDPTPGSGLFGTYYTINGVEYQYEGSFSLTGLDGAYTITYWSNDTAGNTETQNTVTVYLVSLKVNSYVSLWCRQITQFYAIFFKIPCRGYMLVGTWPCDFFYNVEVTNNMPITLSNVTIKISIPSDFVLECWCPIRVYLGCRDITWKCTISGTTIIVNNVLPGSTIHVVACLDYALIGRIYPSLSDFGVRNYNFSAQVLGSGSGSGGSLVGTYTSSFTLSSSTVVFGYKCQDWFEECECLERH
jgi:hypothetical protein